MDILRIGLVSVSDRASGGVYQDKGIPALEEWLTAALVSPFKLETRLIPDEQTLIEQTLCELVDEMGCHLVLTTGGTGPARRDVTPDATLAIADRVMPGFGEQMRQISLHYVPTAILSRQVGAIRKQALIINLPGQPKSIKETLEGVKDEQGKTVVHGIFASVPYCIQLLEGPYVETQAAVVAAFRPKNARREINL
ncbi:molybdopterin adenylyltransferase [Serratia plymuthica]|jgi:molybdopterin adenylyltransferase|uniref:Molybdopterin adenylyltransferase n=2 Tax=Serratia plymuthica TaxID=82996 RepID=A0A2X4TXL0_SERPL|nr:molybdopterin adenylyltransferase [Serratia plymuthica]AGO53569.1 molybdopterin adenylyltransferase Mog [Serratia plymuthica 4Rx13]AGP42920.1 molybdenum cofactor biosynthesis protein MogA [Serratia plymuthica S13]AHY05615.1 molybdenum cofactor biosynthesis protein MogA [Serratia plymuthica]ANJ92927.1 molybdenum cofactor biosynthesis protein MogA [Serratia plymuthica]ANJ97009.1 molybdenum cofactor biosynthesis protein MogA [Serratia plymuthica]